MSQSFGRRKQSHTVIIANGDKVRHFQIRPWVSALLGAVILAASIGYLGATSYLIFRDDIINVSLMRQARIQHAYEDRISSLRAQVDRITSHRLLDQQFVESKIAELASRQDLLARRAGKVAPLLERASGLRGAAPVQSGLMPLPKARPSNSTDGDQASLRALDNIATGSINRVGRAPSPLKDVQAQLADIEQGQLTELALLTQSAVSARQDLIKKAKSLGLSVTGHSATGGPFVPPQTDADTSFQGYVEGLELALSALDETRDEVRAFPIAHPAPGRAVTSRFGNRRDPILGKSAFHGGIDFRTPTGTPILATANGTVVKAGRHGGYGNLIEIKHDNGLSTRYAHLSRIHVKKGQTVQAGVKIGAAGSTGRSTGPHLHYEVRRGGKAINPQTYLTAGHRLKDYIVQ
ncbi:MAG: M23 family metallopeptidase [Pseudomonadota bacterium]